MIKMVLKTFNVEGAVYNKFSQYCKNLGISMSKQVEFFMESFLEEPEVRPEYLKKLERIRKEGYGKTFTSIEELRKHIEG